MVRATALILSGLFCFAVPDRSPPSIDAQTDLQAMQGVWKIVKCVEYGKNCDPELIKGGRITITGNQITFHMPKIEDFNYEFSFKLDIAKKPAHLTAMHDGVEFAGIYALGGDKLVIVMNFTEDDRPRSLQSTTNDWYVLFELVRMK